MLVIILPMDWIFACDGWWIWEQDLCEKHSCRVVQVPACIKYKQNNKLFNSEMAALLLQEMRVRIGFFAHEHVYLLGDTATRPAQRCWGRCSALRAEFREVACRVVAPGRHILMTAISGVFNWGFQVEKIRL